MSTPLVTAEQLHAIMPHAKQRVEAFVEPLNAAMLEFSINTPLRVSAFLSQIAVESGELLYVKELATGIQYEYRVDLGNSQTGDGRLYKGRGLIQITGRHNYTALMMALNIDCVEHPEVVEEPVNACRSAGWFWYANHLEQWADAGNNQAVSGIVNTGSPTRAPERINGLKQRMAYYEVAKKALGIA